MKTNFYLLIVFVIGIVSITNAQTTKKMENNLNQEQKKVLSVITEMTKAFENKDMDKVLEAYEPNAIVMFQPEVAVSGKENLRQGFIQFASVNPKFTYSGHEVFISGNIATHISPWHMEGVLPDGSKLEQNGLSIAILRKQEDGSWLMIQDNPHGSFLLNQ